MIRRILTSTRSRSVNVIWLAFGCSIVLCSCDALNQNPEDDSNDIFIFNETHNECPLFIYMDSQFQLVLRYNCPNCAILDVDPGVHVLEAYRDIEGVTGPLAASAVITINDMEDWWWRIRYCPEYDQEPTPTPLPAQTPTATSVPSPEPTP